MTQFVFDQLPSDTGPIPLLGTDSVVFDGGAARNASVTFGFTATGLYTAAISFDGQTVSFDAGIVAVSANHNLLFNDGSTLFVGGTFAESAAGGAGDDALFGGAGNDTLNGHEGQNVLQGNQGDDSLQGGSSFDAIYGGQGADTISTGAGQAGEQGDFAQGNRGDDSIVGAAGPDTLLGGQGDDVLVGGAGDDYLSGDLGDNTMTGGAGADIFHVSNGGNDRITDFVANDGDRIQLDPGTTFHVTQVGDDTVITLPGGQLTLAGLNSATLHGDSIFGF